VQAALRPNTAPDAGRRGEKGDGDPSPKHGGGLAGGAGAAGAGQGKTRSTATERATPLNVKRHAFSKVLYIVSKVSKILYTLSDVS
jgi:hypothetical protein